MIDYDLEIQSHGRSDQVQRRKSRRVDKHSEEIRRPTSNWRPWTDYNQLATNKLLLTFLIQSSVTMCPISSRVHPAVIGD